MALNLPNFLAAPIVRSINPGLEGMFSGGVQAYQQGQKHREMMQEQAMKNALLQQYGARDQEAGIGLKEAQADFYRDPMRQMTPQQKIAMDLSGGDPAKYSAFLEKLAQKQSSGAGSKLSKLNQERAEIENDPNLNDEQKQQRIGQIDSAIDKETSDTKVRNQRVAAENLLLAFKRTNIDDLVRYSGPQGQAKLKYHQGLDLAGKAPEEYYKYLEAKANAEVEAKEARAMFADSIRKENQEQLKKMMNPSGLFKSPEAAKRQLSAIRDTFRETANNLKKSSPSAYKGREPQGQAQGANAGGGMMGRIRDKTGQYKIFQIRPENVDAFRQAGGEVIE